MYVDQACQALRSGVCLEIQYDGYIRVVEVHAVGFSTAGKALMRVWQVSGGSVSGEPSGWKLLRLDETRGVSLTSEVSQAPRRGYKPNDPAMTRVACQL
jgi:hypothetical protein